MFSNIIIAICYTNKSNKVAWWLVRLFKVQWDLGSNPRSPILPIIIFLQQIQRASVIMVHHASSLDHLPDGLQAKSNGQDCRPTKVPNQRVTWDPKKSLRLAANGPNNCQIYLLLGPTPPLVYSFFSFFLSLFILFNYYYQN